MVEKMMQNNKKGISLVVLMITIAVTLILLSTIVISINSAVDNSKLASFATDLATVEDLTKTYYMQNGNYPTKNIDEESKSEQDIFDIVGNESHDSFVDELKLNNDFSDNTELGVFYTIDLSKLDIDSSKRGTQKNGENVDIYVVSATTNNIYYLKGIKVKKNTYFSLTSKLTNKVKINNATNIADNGSVSVQTIEGLTVKKITKGWTNNMGIYVQANLSSGEALTLKANGVDEKTLVTSEGNNEFSFNDLSEVNGFSASESDIFKNSNQGDKKLIFTKKLNNSEVGKIEVDMSNYETGAPTWDSSKIQIEYQDEYNFVSFNVSDNVDGSGVKEVRYEYLTKYDKTGEILNYYTNVTSYDEAYLKARGKKSTPDNAGNVALKLDKDIQGIQILIIDKAGNVNTETFNIGLYGQSNDIYEGIDVKENTESMFSYSLILVNQVGIATVDVSTSNDGIDFLNNKTLNVNSTSDNNIKIVEDKYENLGNVKYLKATAKDTNGNTRTRVFKLDQKSKVEVGKIVDETKTFNLKSTGTYYNPVIPKGFAPINVGNAEWGSSDGFNNGLVITDNVDINGNSTGNEFVWIPIESSNDTEFSNKFVLYSWIESADDFAKYFEDEDDEFNSMKESVRKNGGFYIARYESAIPNGGNVSTVDGTQLPLSKSGLNVWNSITFLNAVKMSRSMYPNSDNNKGVISTLTYGKQWDAAIKFIEKDNNTYPKNSTDLGNYNNNTNNTSNILESGLKTSYSLKNIYDMAGNIYEFTNEKYSTDNRYIVYRGGSYATSGITNPASSRTYNTNANYSDIQIGFRVSLYIKN